VIITFVEIESAEEEYFLRELPGHELRFVQDLGEIGDETEILSGFPSSPIDRTFLEAHRRLRCIAARSGTADHIDLSACGDLGIVVCLAPDYGATTAAEHTFALILALSRRLREAMAAAQEKSSHSYEAPRGFDLAQKTLGIVGLHRIGQRVATLAQAFQMRVVACNPNGAMPGEAPATVEWLPLDDLLRESDVITLHARLSPETRHLLNRETLARCRRGVLIVNTARGELIDTAALDEALDSGQAGGAGLDVLEEERVMREPVSQIITSEIVDHLRSDAEPHQVQHGHRLHRLHKLMTSDTLLARNNVVFTPQVAFNSVEAVRRLNAATVANLRAFAAGQPINLARP
jgi:D-lactate dehydrogenase